MCLSAWNLYHVSPIGEVCPEIHPPTPHSPHVEHRFLPLGRCAQRPHPPTPTHPHSLHVEHSADWESASWVEDADYCHRRCDRGQGLCPPWFPRLYAGMAGMGRHHYWLAQASVTTVGMAFSVSL